MSIEEREASIVRKTKETDIALVLKLDHFEAVSVETGIGFFNHMLEQIGYHGRFSLSVKAEGDLDVDGHHTVEDVGITLGQAFAQALGDLRGIERFASVYVPLDEALSRVVIDISGRPGLHMFAHFTSGSIGGFDTQLVREFFQGFVNHAKVTLHIDNLRGENAHHQVESIFKAFARALRIAVKRSSGDQGVPSTKGML